VNTSPDWLEISRLASGRSDLLYYHSAIVITFESAINGTKTEERIYYTPHGIYPDNLELAATSSVKTLALLHGLHDVSLGNQLNLGGHNGLTIQRLLQARYWIGTHDEVKKSGGLVGFFLRRKVVTLEEALSKEKSEGRNPKTIENVQFVELGNGESLRLE